MRTEIEKFIGKNLKHWKTQIQNPPYYVKVVEDGPYTMLHYSQIDSDFYNEVVKDCRSVVIKEYDTRQSESDY